MSNAETNPRVIAFLANANRAKKNVRALSVTELQSQTLDRLTLTATERANVEAHIASGSNDTSQLNKAELRAVCRAISVAFRAAGIFAS